MYLSDACGSAVLSDGDMVSAAGHCGKACPGSCFWPRRRKAVYWRQWELKSWLGDCFLLISFRNDRSNL